VQTLDHPFVSWAVALGIGLLIGIERERRKGKGPGCSAAGLQTFVITPADPFRRGVLSARLWDLHAQRDCRSRCRGPNSRHSSASVLSGRIWLYASDLDPICPSPCGDP
jgi:hypothetical protein